MRAIDNYREQSIGFPGPPGMQSHAVERPGTMAGKRQVSNHDATGITLFGGSGESRAFRARRRGLSCLPTHAQHPDQKARGISRTDADRAQRQIVRSHGDGAECGREGAPDRDRGRCPAVLDPCPAGTLDRAAQLGRDSDTGAIFLAAAVATRQEPLPAAATSGARGPDRAPVGAAARLSNRRGLAGAAVGRRRFRGISSVR